MAFPSSILKVGLGGLLVAIRDHLTNQQDSLRSRLVHRPSLADLLVNTPNHRPHMYFRTCVQIVVMDMQGKSQPGKQRRINSCWSSSRSRNMCERGLHVAFLGPKYLLR